MNYCLQNSESDNSHASRRKNVIKLILMFTGSWKDSYFTLSLNSLFESPSILIKIPDLPHLDPNN